MSSTIDTITVNHRQTADLITVSASDDGLTVRLHFSQPMGTFPIAMWMGGNDIVLSRTQWRRLKIAIDTAFDPAGTQPADAVTE